MSSIQKNIEKLKSYLDELRPRRSTDPMANDLYEEADDLRSFAEIILRADTKADYVARIRQERDCIRKIREFWSKERPEEFQGYSTFFDVAEEVLKAAEAIKLPEGGHLGTTRSIRENFLFLQREYGFVVAHENPLSIRYTNGTVFVELEWTGNPFLSCKFGLESEPRKHFWVKDLLYLHSDQRYRTLPQRLHLDTEAEAGNWFKFLAGIWRQYGHDVLVNRPGIFDRLAEAQEQWGEEYTREMDRAHGSAGPEDG
jgi:hypothetical protein